MRQDRDLNNFLEQAPWMRAWIHECAACHVRGYKAELQDSSVYDAPLGKSLRRLVEQMSLDEAGVCEQCQKTGGHLG